MYLFHKPSISNSSTESHCVFKIFCDNAASQFNPTHANASFLYPLKTIKWLYQTLKILSKNLPWWLIQSIDGSNDSFYFAVNDNTLNFRQILTVLSAHETGCIDWKSYYWRMWKRWKVFSKTSLMQSISELWVVFRTHLTYLMELILTKNRSLFS